MTGYTRQSAADIVPTAVVRAAPINNEYNKLRDAFSASIGHKHDGTAAEGVLVPLISDTDGFNKVSTNIADNSIDVFVEVAGAAAKQVVIVDGAIVPNADNDLDLGTSAKEFKNLYITGTANIDSLIADTADINAGTIDGTVIGASSALAITGTIITATTNFAGSLTGAVTGNTAGTHTGAVVGNVTGNLTGNVTASTGTSTFNDVTINGSLNMDAGTAGTITNLTSPTNSGDAATKGYVDTSISNLVASAPGTLDTLNELAAALGNDASFSTTITTSIAAKLPLAGGTMSGAIAMGTSKITGLGDPTANQDAATKTYVDTADNLRLSKTGGTMSGAIAMGTSKITGLGTPTADADATTKLYVDGILGSATAAAISASNAATSASAASGSASAASTSETNAASSATAASNSYDSFDDRYLGAKASNPTLDNDSNALLTGALYYNTVSSEMRVYSGTAWLAAYVAASTYLPLSGGTMTGAITYAAAQTTPEINGGTGQTSFAVGDLLYASTTTALSKLADVATGNALISGGISTAPSWGKIGLTTHVSGTLPIANGGTNSTATPTAGTVPYGTGSAFAFTAAGTTGQALLSNGSSAPTWGTAGVSAGKAIAFAIVMGF